MASYHRCGNGTSIVVSEYAPRTWITNSDGRQIYGEPERTAAQAATALELGYGGDVGAMVADHDPLHALLTDWLGMPASVSLFGGDPAVGLAEEAAVLAVQKLMRLAGVGLPGFGKGNE